MSDDGDNWMARFIEEYDNTEDPDLRAELLMCHGIHPEVLSSARQRLARRSEDLSLERRRLARRKKKSPTGRASAPSEPRVRRTSRATRRPTTPRRAGSPCTQVIRTRKSTQNVRTTGQTVTITTTTVTITTVTTITTTNS